MPSLNPNQTEMSRKPSFNVVIVYDDFYSALRAQELAGRMAAELEPVFVMRTEVWNFSLVTHPDLCDRAAKDAIEADMIIISASEGDDLPCSVKGWMQSWLPQKRGGLAVLVALVGRPAGRAASGSPPAALSLRQMAKAGGMDFFCRTGSSREDCFRYAFGSVHRQGVGRSVKPGGTDYSGPAWRGRGQRWLGVAE
jgi:hypothetical protein